MCDNCGRSPMAGNSVTAVSLNEIDIGATLAEKDTFIREQRDHIIQLKRELDGVASERDLLLCEVSNLRFELEMVELKRLQDERFGNIKKRQEKMNMKAKDTMERFRPNLFQKTTQRTKDKLYKI